MPHFIANLLQDLGFALRDCWKWPALMVTSVFVLAIGLGGSTAAFSIVYQLVLKPIPYRNPERLVFIHNRFPRGQVPVTGVSGFDYATVRRQRNVFEDAAVFLYNDLVMTGAGEARHLNVVNTSSSLFSVLDVKPQLGRPYNDSEDRFDAPGTAVLSDRLWHSEFGGDRHILGRKIRLDGSPFTVVGVMPSSFAFPSRETQVWIPLALRPGEFTIQGGRLEKWLHMIARLAPGVDLREGDAALRTITAQLAASYPAFYPAKDGWRFAIRQLADEQTEHIRPWLNLALGAVLSILLAACITVGGLIVVRTTARSGEIAVRKAMGATDRRIISQILTEVGLIAVLGCGLGVLFSVWALQLVNVYGPMSAPVVLQPQALSFALALTLVSTAFAGVLPARVAVRLPIEQTLRNTGTRATALGTGTRNRIVAVQIAFAVILISTAVELNRSFLNLTRVPLGFEQHRVWTGSVTFPVNYTVNQTWNSRFFEPLLSAVRSIPGVESASLANSIPFNPGGIWTEALRIPGHLNRNPHPEAQICIASPGYFQTLGVPLIAGRTFTEADRAGATPIAIIDEELARRYFPTEEPIGKLISVGGSDTSGRIVGVVGTVHNSDLGGPAVPEVYYPQLQERTKDTYIALRVAGNLDPTTSVRRAIAKLDPGVALYDVQFMDARVASSLKLRGFVDLLLNGLASAGFVLALIGLYSSLAHLVELRRREIGIRAVLGATRVELVTLIVMRSCAVLAAGIGIGIGSAIFVSHIIRAQLFETTVMDRAVWITSLGAILLLAFLSSFIPAWRAVHIEPAAALRSE